MKVVSSFALSGGDISKELIDKFREAQNALRNELGINEVEISYRTKEYHFLEKKFLKKLNSQKHHYVVVYLFHSLYNSNEKKFPLFYQSFLGDKKIVPYSYDCPALEKLVKNYEKCTDQAQIDFFTFGPLPSYFYFFTTKFGNASFIKTIKTIEDPQKYYSFSRMAFYSPLFLRFISKVFIPALSVMTPQRGTQNYNLTSIGASIKQRWKSNTNIIPPYIIKLLKIRRHDIKPADVLFNGFFAEATSPPKGNVSLIQISCLVDFFQSPSTHLIQAIRDILTPGEPHSIINDLVDITIQSKSPHFKFISTKDRNNAPALFSSHVISSIEYTFLSKSFRTIDNLQYIPYATKPKNLIVEDSIHNLKEVTMVKSNFKPEVSLRHLLKKSDSIPYFSETPLGLTTEGFVNAYLVQMGPPETLLSRQEEANMLNMLCGFDNEANLIRTLSKVVLERKKEIRALSAYTSITTSILSIGQLTSDTRIRVFNVLLHYLIYTELFKSNNNINNEQRTIQYMNDPKLFLDDYQQIIIKGKNELPKYLITKTYPEICYSILTSSFNFQYFQETHSELSEYDNQLSSIISTMATPFVQEQFPLPTEPYDVNKKPKKVILRELVEKLRDEFEIWENIILAFMEINPIRKISLLKNAFDMVYKYFSTNCPPSMELGADEYTPIFITCFLYSNPYGMLSNYVFINDFACAQVFGGMFSYPTSQMMASCKSIFQSAMPNEELTRFCKIEL